MPIEQQFGRNVGAVGEPPLHVVYEGLVSGETTCGEGKVLIEFVQRYQ